METLRVGTAVPDPPFNGMSDDTGLDVDLMNTLAEHLGATAQFIPYEGADAGSVFDELSSTYDCITGATVTAQREKSTTFVPPYLISGQALAVDTRRLRHVKSVDDLNGLTIGVQEGNTSQPIAERLVADGRAGAVRVYDYGTIQSALADLAAGACDAVVELAPVLTHLVRPIAGVEVVQRGLSIENIAIAVAMGDQALLGRLTVAQAELEADGTLQQIRRKWLGNPYADQSLAVH